MVQKPLCFWSIRGPFKLDFVAFARGVFRRMDSRSWLIEMGIELVDPLSCVQ